MNDLMMFFQQVADAPPPAVSKEQYSKECIQRMHEGLAISRKNKTINTFRDVMKGRGVMGAASIGSYIDRDPTSVRKTMDTRLIPWGFVVRAEDVAVKKGVVAFRYLWIGD